jgi:TetR/AcrR family transcriptional regulator, mexJK operon transcriptional repressor
MHLANICATPMVAGVGTEWYQHSYHTLVPIGTATLTDTMAKEKKGTLTRSGDELTARRNAILTAAGAVFFEYGFEAATTLEIAKRARTSKRALYELFGSKDMLLTALIRESSQQMRAPLELAPPDCQAGLLETLRRFGRHFLEQLFHPHRVAMYRLAIAEVFRSGKVATELEGAGRQPVVDALTRFLTHAARKGLVRSEDIELLTTAFFGILIGGIHTQLLLGLEEAVAQKAIQHRVDRAVEVVGRIIKP